MGVRRRRMGRRGFRVGKSVRGSEDEEELEDVRTQDQTGGKRSSLDSNFS